jgi:glycosyltransferase involved in cell wall biosynthesis
MTELKHASTPFRDVLINELDDFLKVQKKRFPKKEILQMDMHCHDYNSDVPDELLGRILNVPETWVSSETVINTLRQNGCNALTITNHNNARSCFKLQDQGMDILTGCEFSVTVPDFNTGIHVLTYGFTPSQEVKLNKLRKDVYKFQSYTREHNIPTIWAHPLYHYSPHGVPGMEFFEKMLLVFERFEVINGQRDTWQNMLVKVWLESVSDEMINDYSRKYNLDPEDFCINPYEKSMSGGSDSHMGIFSGLSGTYLHVPHLEEKRIDHLDSELALEAIREGRMAPYGSHNDSEKLTVAFLDYVCQIALYRKDPGLLRILLHKGTSTDKMLALVISNAFAELKKHKVTMRFIELFHKSLTGIPPKSYKKLFIKKAYKPVFEEAIMMANTKRKKPGEVIDVYRDGIISISQKLNKLLWKRFNKKIEKLNKDGKFDELTLIDLVEKFELPSEFRAYVDQASSLRKKHKSSGNGRFEAPNVSDFLDGLSFPLLSSSMILAANFTSAKVLYNARPLLEEFSSSVGKLKHPRRMLWLTDTFDDNNGVSHVLQSMHKEIKERRLPIDILVCSNRIKPDDHLIVLEARTEFTLPFYKHQPFRIPDFLDIHRVFKEGEYDRVICSTEGPMGAAALFLKHAYSVPAFFYIHTDWMVFAKKVLNIEQHYLSRIRRVLRAYYNAFDGVFVLNSDQRKWLSSKEMGLKKSKVHLTAHWTEDKFKPSKPARKELFGLEPETPVLLFAGRVSKEKGTDELADIYSGIKTQIPEIKLVVAGTGPDEKSLKKAIPNAVFLGWVDHNKLPQIYSSADLLILPSRFDTFSLVVLEALSCGLPVVAYKTKGPKDIIKHDQSGFLAVNKEDMINLSLSFFQDNEQEKFKEEALKRSQTYSSKKIIKRLTRDVGLYS